MSRTRLRTSILIVAVVVGFLAVPLTAMAASHDDRQAKDGRAHAESKRARHDELVAAKRAAVDAFKENRAQILDAYRDSFKAIRESYLENKTRIISECRGKAAPSDADDSSGKSEMSKEERLAWAHCVRDGLKPLKEAARADIKDARAEAKLGLKDLARAAVKKFHAEKMKVDKRQGDPGADAAASSATANTESTDSDSTDADPAGSDAEPADSTTEATTTDGPGTEQPDSNESTSG